MNNTGSIIAELRREAGYTQKTLAEALGITDKAVSKWERGICLPDVSLLPKLSLLLDADIELLLSNRDGHTTEDWVGVLDLSACPHVDLSQKVYDKPMVYYMLVHFLLLNIQNICVLTTQKNREYLNGEMFQELGFRFFYNLNEVSHQNLMIMNRACFLFGSDLTRHFQGAMVSQSVMTLVPEGLPPVFLFCPAEYSLFYAHNPEYLYEISSSKTLGRGMVCIEVNNEDSVTDLSAFVRMYQKNTGLRIADLEEIARQKNAEGVNKDCDQV